MIPDFLAKPLASSRLLVRRHLEWTYHVTTRRSAAVLAACCLLFLIASASITRIHFQADIFQMFPQKGPLALFIDVMHWTGSSGNAYFLLEGDKNRVIAEAEVFAKKLRELKVDGAPAFRKVKHAVFDPAELDAFAEFLTYATTHPQLFVSPADVPSYLALLSPEEMQRSLQRAEVELAAPGAVPQLVAADPLYLRNLILPRLKKSSESLAFDPASPYFLSRDGKVLIIIAEPARPVTDTVFARKLVAGINEARAGSPVNISCAGAHLSAVADEAVIKENVLVGVVLSLAIVLSLFYLAYRRFLPTLLIPVILLFGVVLAVAVGGLIYPTMSVISFGFASLIVGIGTDYSIHLYDRFHFERASGLSSEEALKLSVVDTGHALFTAATTTSIPFLALAVSDVRVLAELGLLVGLGVIFSMYATLFFLPPLLLLMERRYPLKAYQPLPSFGLRPVWRVACRHPRMLIIATVLAAVSFLASSGNIRFESDLKNLQPKFSEAFLAQEKMEKHLSISPKEMIVAVEGRNLEEVTARGNAVALIARKYKEKGELAGYSSLLDVINDQTDQRSVVSALQQWPSVTSLGGEVDTALASHGFEPEAFRHYIDGLSNLGKAQVIPFSEGVARLAASPFRGIIDRYLAHDADGYHLLTYLHYSGPEFNQDAFLGEVKGAVPGARATSLDLVSRQLTEEVKRSFVWAVILGLVMVVIFLLSHFSSLPGILYSMFPLACGVITMIGVMSIFGMPINFMNVMVLVTILGMASDFGLHIGHRVRDCRLEEYEDRFVQSGRAILLSALTTITGFGSLALTEYAAMASIGSATNIGVAATTLYALAAVPAFIVIFQCRRSSWS